MKNEELRIKHAHVITKGQAAVKELNDARTNKLLELANILRGVVV